MGREKRIAFTIRPIRCCKHLAETTVFLGWTRKIEVKSPIPRFCRPALADYISESKPKLP
jgi:hypothetical protein